MTTEIELVAKARAGDRAALDELVRSVKDLIYNLSIRMLGDRADAEDVTQEILIRVVTGLATFRGESAFETWVYRVASNHLLTARKRHAEQKVDSFDAMAGMLDGALAADVTPLDDQVLITEAKRTCTSLMLMCLDREHRLAFILGEILDLHSDEGAAVLGIAPDAFRKRLSRAREKVAEFATRRCGLVDASLPCRCAKVGAAAVARGNIDSKALRWATHPIRVSAGPVSLEEDPIDALGRAVAVLRNHPDYATPSSVVDGLRLLIEKSPAGMFARTSATVPSRTVPEE